MMKIVEIKRFRKPDFEAIAKLKLQLDPGSGELSEDHLKSLIRASTIHLFVVKLKNGEIAGTMTIVTNDLISGSKAWIEDVVVAENHRGKGFGKAMIVFAIDYCKSLGINKIDLTSRPTRIEANELYRKLGFVQRETNVYRYYGA